MGTAQYDPTALGRPAWNAGRQVGVKKPLKQRQIWAVRFTVQYEGEATKVPTADIEHYQEAHLNSVPAEREFIERGAVMFKATPRWIRYSDFNKEPPELIEIQF